MPEKTTFLDFSGRGPVELTPRVVAVAGGLGRILALAAGLMERDIDFPSLLFKGQHRINILGL